MKLKVLGRVDLSTGKIYDNKGNEVILPKPSMPNFDKIQEAQERRRAWLAGEFGYTC